MKNNFFIFKLPYHTDKFNKIFHIDPMVYEIEPEKGLFFKGKYIHRIKNGQFVRKPSTRSFLLDSEETMQEKFVDDIKSVDTRRKNIGGDSWLVCSQLGLAFYKKLLLMDYVFNKVSTHIDVVTGTKNDSYRNQIFYRESEMHFKECSIFLSQLKDMNLLDLMEKTKMEFPECFI